MRLLQFCDPGLLYIPHSTVFGCFVRNIKDLCKTVLSIPFPDRSWLKSIHSSYWQLQTKTNLKRREEGSSYYCLLGEISRGECSSLLSCLVLFSPQQKLEIKLCFSPLVSLSLSLKQIWKTNSKHNIQYIYSVSSCLVLCSTKPLFTF